MRFEEEPINEDEIFCAFCGRGTIAIWEVILDDEKQIYACENDYKNLSDEELIYFERRIGDMTWEDNLELKKLKKRI